jgi:hypothetical protein
LVQTKAQVVAHGQQVLARDLVVTNHDIRCLIVALRDLAGGGPPHFELQTLEQHAIVTGQAGEIVAGHRTHGAISLWVGEPYRLMRGIRIMAAFDAILAFCADLETELTGMVQRFSD